MNTDDSAFLSVGGCVCFERYPATLVRMAITISAINGLIALLITVLALIGAVNRYRNISTKENVAFAVVALVLLVDSALTAESLATTISGWL